MRVALPRLAARYANPCARGLETLKVTAGRHSTAEMDLVRTTRACGQARIRDRAGLAELDVPAASGEALRGGAQGELRHRDLWGCSRCQQPTQAVVGSTQPPFDCPRRRRGGAGDLLSTQPTNFEHRQHFALVLRQPSHKFLKCRHCAGFIFPCGRSRKDERG